jgi:hypothetical protein
VFQALLVSHAEPLFLVDNDQAQIPELHVLLEQTVRADHYVHRAGCQLSEHGVDFLRGLKARQHGHAGRERREAL